jgi:hypothetical protein
LTFDTFYPTINCCKKGESFLLCCLINKKSNEKELP